ncbi:MAG: DUF4129 domain-containing protein [Candidatus Thermoplasmatota archaeon]|jgi:hypothetical protein|nr:DUF4129 domain-containing protein [Candidatus Thermoplasmatota archaeon]
MMRKVFAIVIVIVMLAMVFYQTIPTYENETAIEPIGISEEPSAGSYMEANEEQMIQYEPEQTDGPQADSSAAGYSDGLLRLDGTIDPIVFQVYKERIQRENDQINNPPPKQRSRFHLTAATGISFIYPTNWPRVMYYENYSVVGVLFEDSNENGLWNQGEIGVPNAPVHVYWGEGHVREILPAPITGATQATLGSFSTYFTVTETQEGLYPLNFTFKGLTTRNGTTYYEHTPGSPPPGGHWLATEPSTWPPNQVDYRAEIWHNVKIDFQVTSPDLDDIEVGDTLEITGTLEDADLHWGLSQKVLHVKFDNNPVYPSTVTTSGTGTFSYQYKIPETIRPGKHTIGVEFHSGYTDPQQEKPNYYYVDNSTVVEFKVHRPTHFIVDDRVVYRTDTINISGAIVDNRGQGPDPVIANESFKYEVIINWGDPSELYYEPGMKATLLPSGNFTRQFTIKKTQPLTRVHITYHFRVENADHGETMYYREATGEAYYTVKARTILELHVMDKDGKNELDIVSRTGPTSAFKITGVLWDKDQRDASGHWTSPIEKMSVDIWWGDKYLGERTTDQFGRFSIDKNLGINDPIGPVMVRANMDDTYWYKGFDTDSYAGDGSYYGKIVDVVAKTTIEIMQGSGLKGEKAVIRGRLYDDRGAAYGIGNRSVELYWKKTKFAPLGSSIGEAHTDNNGNFVLSSFQIPKTQGVGDAFVVGIFRGSEKVIHSKDKQKHFTAGDAYDYTESEDITYNISAYIYVSIDPSILNGSKYTRGDTIKISGEVVEVFENKRTSPPRYVKGIKVSAFFMWDGGEQKLPDTTTDDFGQYEIVASVPKSLEVGPYILKMYFNNTQKYVTKPQFLESRSIVVVADTYIKIVDIPEDVTGDEISDIGYVNPNVETGYQFSILLLEKNTLLNEPVPVNGTMVSLTVTLWDDSGIRYINLSNMKTNYLGRIDFNFTGFRSVDGISIQTPGLGASGKALIEFKGSGYLTKSDEEIDLNYIARPIPPPKLGPTDLQWWLDRPASLIGVGIFLVLLILGIILLVLYLRKRARIRGIKRIIKRAADQLIAGNEYTAVIFKSYQKLGMHLRRFGYLRREAETFREFEDAVRTALPVDKNSLNGFLTILEEARYSSHEIGESQRNNAITNLRGIESSLTFIQLDEEEAMKKLEESEADFVETEIILKK